MAEASYVDHLLCPRCDARASIDVPQNVCACGSPWLVEYDLEAARRALDREALAARPPTLWRYAELLPLRDAGARVTLGEGMTPLLRLKQLGSRLGLEELWLKDEGACPTGSFKARGAAVGVSRARELRICEIGMPTAGNAGGAWAAYCARAGIRLHVAMPRDAPRVNQVECRLYGAELTLVDGLISDAGKLVQQGIREHGWFDASTLREPYRIEGKKTMGYEIAEQLDWHLPDVIVYPAGGGVGLIGLARAFRELRGLGWIPAQAPCRLVIVQAEGCAPLVKAWNEGRPESEPWQGAQTLASGLRVPKALGDFLVLRALRDTDGAAVAVSDSEIVEALRELARQEGLWVCPEGAATLAAARRLQASGWIRPREKVVLLNTGSGLKYPDVGA